MKAFFITIPHSGEKIPEEVSWLKGLSEPHLMRDVDRYVDLLYMPTIRNLKLPHVLAEWHRYVVDLNRLPGDVDADSVQGSTNPSGSHTTGLHWVKTTIGEPLIPSPITQELHQRLVQHYFEPFHVKVRGVFENFKKMGAGKVFHLDAHSMPSKGTSAHRDPGEDRHEIVISDVDGVSCEAFYKDLVISAYKNAGFDVGYNWPYKGGRVTQTYGHPDQGQNSIQVEINRKIYMDEESKKLKMNEANKVQQQLAQAVEEIYEAIPNI